MLTPVFGGALAAYGSIVAGLFLFQRQLLYRPSPARPALADLAILGVREIALTTKDGLTLFSWYLPPRPRRPVITYFHGNGGHVGYRAERLRRFAREGYGVLLAEYRGYAGNPGVPCQNGLFADGDAALDFLTDAGIEPSEIVLWGESLGSGVAVYLAAHREVAGLILEAPFTSVAAAAQRHYPFVPAALLIRDRFELAVPHQPDRGAAAGVAWRTRHGRARPPRARPARRRDGGQGGLVFTRGRPRKPRPIWRP